MSTIEVTELSVYPIKSTAGISLSTAEVENRGLQWDRRWGLFDDAGQVITARDYPQLLGISSEITDTELKLDIHGGMALSAPLRPETTGQQAIAVWREATGGIEVSLELSAWFSRFLGVNTRLLLMDTDCVRPVASKR